MAAPSSGIESIVPLPPSGYLSVAPPCLITYCGNHPPLRCERSSADTKDSVGFRVQWILPVLQRGRSASARRVLRNCLWCGIGYRVRDPGDSRRASLKLVLLVPMGDPGDSRDPDDSRRASLKRVRNRARLLLPEGLIPAFAPGLIEARTGRGAGRFRSFPVFVPGLSVAISQHPGVAIGRQSAVESCTGSSVFRGRPRRRFSALVAAVVGCRQGAAARTSDRHARAGSLEPSISNHDGVARFHRHGPAAIGQYHPALAHAPPPSSEPRTVAKPG